MVAAPGAETVKLVVDPTPWTIKSWLYIVAAVPDTLSILILLPIANPCGTVPVETVVLPSIASPLTVLTVINISSPAPLSNDAETVRTSPGLYPVPTLPIGTITVPPPVWITVNVAPVPDPPVTGRVGQVPVPLAASLIPLWLKVWIAPSAVIEATDFWVSVMWNIPSDPV